MEVTGRSKTGEAGHKAFIARAEARAAQPPPVVAEPQHAEGRMAKSKSEGVNFHIEITVTSGLSDVLCQAPRARLERAPHLRARS
jgi:hypothetical protein